MCDFIEDHTPEFKEYFQIFNQRGKGKTLYPWGGKLMREAVGIGLGGEDKAGGGGAVISELLRVLGNPKSDEMNVKVLDLEHFLTMLQTVAKDKDLGTYEDYREDLSVLKRKGTVAGAEIHYVLVIVGKIIEEGEMLVAGHEDSNGCIIYKELVAMVLNV
ncbi:myosin light polypeptide 6-like [Grammomys surdaster]|uniref:myosin light polypeptide 6-like n=1 Tax=Grammomys surdaster TaxID=491861 RepID=UPI00109F2C91|nr:myosin light polypeptide 6-like [Grammomys surdaster]